MGHFFRTAVEVIGVAVAIAAAIPTGGASAAGGATLLSSALGVSVATASGIAAGLSVGIAGIEALTAKTPAQLGNPSTWQSDPQAGIPHVGGRIYTGGQIFLRNTSGKDNIAQTIHTAYSTGPIKGYESLYVSSVATGVDADGNADIVDKGKLVVTTQLGLQPEPSAFGFWDSTPGLTAASKLSGLAAGAVRLYYDTKGGHTLTTEPQIGYVVLGTPVYDPRQDSTYPGGAASGTQRWNDETTWSFTGYDNPGLKSLSWLIGYRMNGNLVMGAGIPIHAINVAQLVEMANVCDANGWKYACAVNSTDDPWDVYTKLLQAGGAVPTRTGTITGAIVNTPKVSLATFERDDIIGPWSIQATQSRRDRINTIVPRYMAEQSLVDETTDANGNTVLQTLVNWGMAQAGAIQVADYVTFDGEVRQKEVDYPFVTGVSTNNMAPNQIAQLARYDIENAREFGPISLPMKPRWMGYRAGDVITGGASLTELGLVGQDIMLLQRNFSPANMTVTFTARSETAAKHAFALGQTTTAPPTPSLSGPPLVPVPGNAAWALTAGVVTSENGTTVAALFLNGTSDSSAIDAVIVEMRVETQGEDSGADWEGVTTLVPSFDGQLAITGVQDLTAYQVAVSYRMGGNTGSRLILGPATAGQTAVPWTAGVVGPGKPADNATVGAPAGTNVGSREAAALVSDVDLNAATLLGYQYDQQTLTDYVNGKIFVAGVPVNTAISTETTQRVDGDNALAQAISLIGASNPAGSAFALNLTTVQVGNGVSMLSRLSGIDQGIATNATTIGNLATTVNTLNSTLGLAQASITNISEVLTTPSGGASAKALFQLNANGHVVGYASTDDGTTGAIVFDFDSFTLMTPAGVALFQASGNTVTMPGVVVDTVKANSITTSSIVVGAVTGASRTVPSSSYNGSGAWVQVASVSLTLSQSATFKVTFNASQGVSNGARDWGLRIKLDGNIIKSYGYGGNRQALTDILTMICGNVTLSGGATHTLTAEWVGADSSIVIGSIDFLTEWSFV